MVGYGCSNWSRLKGVYEKQILKEMINDKLHAQMDFLRLIK